METWIDGYLDASGPLRTAARSFAVTQGFERDPPRGAKALKALARALDAERFDEQQERLFVESAGAFLGMILIDQLSDTRHAALEGEHRLACGSHGYFDPFSSVEQARRSEDVVESLLHAIDLAESEAAGIGPIARVVSEVRGQLVRSAPHVQVVQHFDRRLWLATYDDSMELDLTPVIRIAQGESDSVVRSAVHHVLGSIPLLCGAIAADWEVVREQVLPRLIGPSFVSRVPGSQLGGLLVDPLAGEVSLAMLVRFERGSRYVTRREVSAWPVDSAELQAIAINNLAQRSDRARLIRADDERGPLILARTGDGLDSARLLLPGLVDVLRPELGLPFVAAVPHRDALFACSMDAPEAVRAMAARAQHEAGRAAHAISAQLLVVGADGRIGLHDDTIT